MAIISGSSLAESGVQQPETRVMLRLSSNEIPVQPPERRQSADTSAHARRLQYP